MPTTGSLDLQNQLDAALIEAAHLKTEVAALKAQILVQDARIKELEAQLPTPPDAASSGFNHILKQRRGR